MRHVQFLMLLSLGLALSAQVSSQAQEVQRQPKQEEPQMHEIQLQSNTEQERDQEQPGWALKTNLLYDATLTINLGLEFRTSAHTSLEIPANFNMWTFENNRKWQNWGVQPEFRWWPDGTFKGHFWGLHGHWASYNVGNLPNPPFSQYMKEHRLEGWLAGAGVSWGYRYNFRNSRMAIEATVGLGYAYKDYKVFECAQCGKVLDNKTKHYFGPTKLGLNLIVALGRRPDSTPDMTSVYVPLYVPEVVIYEPTLLASFVTPNTEAIKARSVSGKAYINFPVNSSEILPDFGGNKAELQKIYTSIKSVQDDPDATIIGMTITGYASPEDTFERNQALSSRRSKSLCTHLGMKYGLSESMFAAWGAGEDWQTLDSLVAASSIEYKEQILATIRNTKLDADAREWRMKTIDNRKPYNKMMAEFYPKLRRSDYTIKYTVIPFTIERGKEVFKTRPGNLSLNEMFLIANTYTQGSDAFNQVFETAAAIHPDSDVANLNAAASALGRLETDLAEQYLAKVREHTPEYWNNMGMLAWLRGDKKAAAEAFALAGYTGARNAAELDKHLKSLK